MKPAPLFIGCALLLSWGAAFAQPPVFDVESRFDAGLEGWTLEGPGTLEWVATPGMGGHLRVTRTGAGELHLVAPKSFHGDWRSGTSPSASNRSVASPACTH